MNRKRLEYERKKNKQQGNCVHHWEIEPLYKGFKSIVVERNSVLSADSSKRGTTLEYVFVHINE